MQYASFFIFLFVLAPLSLHARTNRSKLKKSQKEYVSIEEESLKVRKQKAIENQEFKKAFSLNEELLNSSPSLSDEEKNLALIDKCELLIRLDQALNAKHILLKIDSKQLSSSQFFRYECLAIQMLLKDLKVPDALERLLQLTLDYPLKDWPMESRTFFLYAKERAFQYYEKLRTQAVQNFDEGHYQQALQKFEKIHEAIEKGFYVLEEKEHLAQIKYQKAYCYLETNQPQKGVEVLLNQLSIDKLSQTEQYLLISLYEAMGEIEKAYSVCKEYLSHGPHQDALELKAVKYKEATYLYQKNKVEQAVKLLESLANSEPKDDGNEASALYLARHYLLIQKPKQALSYLERFSRKKIERESLKKEYSFLMGRYFFLVQDFTKALYYLRPIIENKDNEGLKDRSQAIKDFAYSLLSIGDQLSDTQLKTYFSIVEKPLNELEKGFENQKLLFEVYQMRIDRLQESSYIALQKQLYEKMFFEDTELAIAMGLKVAKNSPLKEKVELLKSLMELDSQSSLPENLYAEYVLALFDQSKLEQKPELFNQAWSILFKESSSSELLDTLYPKALEAFAYFVAKGVFSLEDPKVWKDIIERQTSHSSQDSYKHHQLNCQLAEFLSPYASQSASKQSYELLIQKLSKALDQPLPQKLKERTFFLIANLHYSVSDYSKARHLFLKLIEDHPKTSYEAKALYLAAECNDLENNSPKISQALRKRLYEHFPRTPYAQQAYFEYYPFSAYLEADPKAIEHLRQMPKLFEHSLYLIPAHYLIARSAQKQGESKIFKKGESLPSQDAKEHYLACLSLFEERQNERAFSNEELFYFSQIYAQASLEWAELELLEANRLAPESRTEKFSELKALYEKVYDLQKDSSLIQLKAQFGLARLKLLENHADEGIKQLIHIHDQVLEKDPYFFAKVSLELGKVYLARQDFKGCLQCCESAEKKLDKATHTELYFELCILESLAYRDLKQYDQAMLILSKLINEEVFSPWSAKAMLMRAEIYALQGRVELAKKQLQEASLKEGSWAKLAQEKLMAYFE